MNRSINIDKQQKIELFQVVLSVVFFIVALIFIYPMYYVLMASFSHPASVAAEPYLLIPVKPTLEIYKVLFRYKALWQGYFNSIIYLAAGTSISVVCTMMGAYAITRPNLWGRKVLLFFIILTMFISGGMIPTFLVVKNLGLLNKRLVMILPSAISTWNLFIARSYIKVNIPEELHDSGEIDGAGEFKYFMLIVLPLSKAILAVLALFLWFNHLEFLLQRTNLSAGQDIVSAAAYPAGNPHSK